MRQLIGAGSSVTVGIAIKQPPPMNKPELKLSFGEGGKVKFYGGYWHPDIIKLYIRGDLSRDYIFKNPNPLSDSWNYEDLFPIGEYSAQVKIIDTTGRESPFSDLVYFRIKTETSAETGREISPEGPPLSIIEKIINPIKDAAKKIAEIFGKRKIYTYSIALATGVFSIISYLISFLAMMAVEINLRTYILLIINYLFSFFRRKRQDRRGFVFDHETGKPIAGALVGLYDFSNMRLVASALTDKSGCFYFVVSPGSYTLSVTKNGYLFPPQINRKIAEYEDLYIGQTLKFEDQGGVVNVRIPMDLQLKAEAKFHRSLPSLFHFSHIIRLILLGLGTIISIIVLTYSPGLANQIIAFSYAILWMFELWLVAREVRFSHILDQKTHHPVDLALARILSPEGRTLQTYVTDALGRFLPFLPNLTDKIRIEKNGFNPSDVAPGGGRLIEGKKFYLEKSVDKTSTDSIHG